jgi:hypothetical protein
MQPNFIDHGRNVRRKWFWKVQTKRSEYGSTADDGCYKRISASMCRLAAHRLQALHEISRYVAGCQPASGIIFGNYARAGAEV